MRQRIRFYQQLAVLARAGLSFRASLERLKERMKLGEAAILSDRVNAGDRLNEAFVAAGFSAFECHLIAAGERSGQFDKVFEHLAEFWKRELEMRQALLRPLYYPAAVLHLAVGVGAMVEAIVSTWQLALFHLVLSLAGIYLLGFLVYVGVRITWASESLRRLWLWVPIIGGSLRTACAYRWVTALRLEFYAGVTLSSAVADAWRASGFTGCDVLATESEEAMRSGMRLSQLMLQWRELPRDWVDFVETGEISGALEAALTNLEAEAARSWELAMQRMNEWLPKIVYFIVLIIVGAVVGRVAYNVLIAPMNDQLKQIDDAMK